jgi:type IV secretory pathway VirB10-like protein
MNRIPRARLLAAAALLALSALAQAQYMWIDEKGVKQFSDRAPPASVPLKNILKAPPGAASATTIPVEPVAVDANNAAKPKPAAAPAPTVADRNADYLKRAKDKLEREQKEKDELIAKADKAENCERARSAKQSVDSGARIGIHDKNGERGFMSDEQRVTESKKYDRVLAGCK